ncbi:YdcF family protein [Candidatus Dojkabacteria bacterium]|nr:YdcF family protein [Candidatus Dojkabacteria bacterium]
MNKRLIRKGITITLIIIAMIFFMSPAFIYFSEKSQIYSNINDLPQKDVAIVFGAGINSEGVPSDMLKDRLLTAVDVYTQGKAKKILVSGDNRFEHYNEPQAMFDFLVELGIPEEDIIKDYAGRRTYDTCYRANEIFEVDNAILVTQGYHLPRALYLCNSLGIKSVGISASRQEYRYELYNSTRETLALYKSLLDIMILKPKPVLGPKLPIDTSK